MRIRSSLLVTCLVVVPLIAMFSHRIPPATRAAVSQWIREAAGGARTSAPPMVQAAGGPAPAAKSAVQRAVPAAPAVEESRVVPVVAMVPVVDPVTTTPNPSLEQLRALGAIAIDCRPLLGARGHIASCRLPVDDAGQLQRVFQATGADPEAAAAKLLADVSAWQRGATASPSRTMRF